MFYQAQGQNVHLWC